MILNDLDVMDPGDTVSHLSPGSKLSDSGVLLAFDADQLHCEQQCRAARDRSLAADAIGQFGRGSEFDRLADMHLRDGNLPRLYQSPEREEIGRASCRERV